MFGSGKRWSVVEYTHRKCLTIDISMMFFVSFSLIFLFAFSSPLFFSFLASFFFFCLEFSRLHFGAAPSLSANISGCWVYVISRRGIVQQGSSFCSITSIFLLFPMKVAGENPQPLALSDSPVGGKSFWECL